MVQKCKKIKGQELIILGADYIRPVRCKCFTAYNIYIHDCTLCSSSHHSQAQYMSKGSVAKFWRATFLLVVLVSMRHIVVLYPVQYTERRTYEPATSCLQVQYYSLQHHAIFMWQPIDNHVQIRTVHIISHNGLRQHRGLIFHFLEVFCRFPRRPAQSSSDDGADSWTTVNAHLLLLLLTSPASLLLPPFIWEPLCSLWATFLLAERLALQCRSVAPAFCSLSSSACSLLSRLPSASLSLSDFTNNIQF